MEPQDNGLKGFSLTFSLTPGVIYLLPPRAGEPYVLWATTWSVLDCFERRKEIKMKGGFLRKFGGSPRPPASVERQNDIRCLILEIDSHPNELSESAVGIFLSIWEQFESGRDLSDKQFTLLEEFLQRLDDD